MKYSLFLLTLLFLFSNCSNKSEKKTGESDTTEIHKIKDSLQKSVDSSLINSGLNTSEAEELTGRAKLIVLKLKDKDFAALSGYVCSREGLSFSNDGFIDTADIRFTKAEVALLWTNSKKYKFPSFAEDVPKMTFKEYYSANVYDKDFTTASGIKINEIKRGPTPSLFNLEETYKQAASFDFYIPAPKEMELDWATLRIIFVKEGGGWCLRHILHDNWTP